MGHGGPRADCRGRSGWPRRGGAAPGPLPQAWGGLARCQEGDGLGEPAGLLGQGIDHVPSQREARARVEARGGLETAAGLGQGLAAVAGCRAPRPAALAGWPGFQHTGAAVSQEGGGRWLGLPAAQSGRWRQGFSPQRPCGQGEGEGRSQWLAPWADALRQGQGAWPQAGGGLACRRTGTRQAALARLEPVAETVRSVCIGVPGPMRSGFAMGTAGVPGPQPATVAIVFEPFLERWPRDTGGLHGAQQPLTMVGVPVMPAGVLKALASRTGVGQCQCAAAEASLRPQTSVGCGLAHIDSNQEQVRRLTIRFTLLGGASILCQSHGTLLLV